MDACCERIFSERGEEGKGGRGGGERGDFTGASLRIADTQGCHNLAEKKLEFFVRLFLDTCEYVYAGTKHIVFNILYQTFQAYTCLLAIFFKISHEILE